jgi:hypothetical protein
MNSTDMISRCLTFVGSFIAAFFWAKLFTSLDVSSPTRAASFGWELASAIFLAGLYVLVEVLIQRDALGRYLRMVRNVFAVSLVGTVAIFLTLFGTGLYLGYIELRNLSVEIGGVVILGGILFVSNFVAVLAVKSMGYAVGLGRGVSVK